MRHHEVLFLHVSDSFAMTAMGHGRASESLIYRADPKKRKKQKTKFHNLKHAFKPL